MRKLKLKGNLESRLCILTSGLLFALLLAVGHLVISEQSKALNDQKTDKYQVLSRILALSFSPITEVGDMNKYRAFAERFMKADADILFVVISESSGKTLFAQSRLSKDYNQKNLFGRQSSNLLRFLRTLDLSGGKNFQIVNIPTMIKPGEMGTIGVGFGTQTVDMIIEGLQARLLCVFAVAFLVGLVGTISLARAISRPIRQLTAAARAVSSGNLDVTIPIKSADEIGELAGAFNHMVVALKESRDRLIERANTDGLTDLYNHRYFQERLGKELSRAERYGRPLSIIMLDIDHFKALNDTHGHPFGDVVLQEVAKLLVSSVRDIDVVSRYGGEEFAIILPESQASEAVAVAERLRSAVRRHCFIGKDGQSIPVTISLGVAQYPIHSTEREGLIMAADLAMYQAKSMGRNRVVAFSSDFSTDKSADPYRLYLLLHATDISTIEAIAAAVDAKEQREPGTSCAVMQDAVALAEALGLSEQERNDVKIASLLHDIGKLGISASILRKNGDLTEEEKRVIRSHPALGYAIVQKSPHLKSMLPGILYHHEAWDGSGYPNCLKGEEIPLIARIIAIVDAYHAMMTDRVHGKKMTPDEAKEELRRCAGTQFDPNLVELFINILDRRKADNRMAA
ncbi:MAG: diguanylate cyclase [Armatimonadota bacterium]|nr:diguanylate cyclase [Armatimonadota bacterium]